MALREILKYPSVEKVTLVDLDPAMTRLFSSNQILTQLNQNALLSKKLTVINRDAFLWLKETQGTTFDALIIDVPDPSNFSVGKLYSVSFFKQLKNIMSRDSLAVVQSTSPLVARKSFWCINNTLNAAGFYTAPYHTFVPSFGEWGFVIASLKPYIAPQKYPTNLRYISLETSNQMFHFASDMSKISIKIQRLDDQVLVRYFDEEWSKYLIY